MNEFMKIELNYQGMFEALEAQANYATAKQRGVMACPDWMAMREFRTVGWRTPRQSGGGTWLIDFISSKPLGEVFCVFKDTYYQRTMTAKYNSKNKTQIVLPHRVSRYKAKPWDDEYSYAHFGVKYVVVKDSEFTLGRQTKDFYQWVHDKFGKDTLIILVD